MFHLGYEKPPPLTTTERAVPMDIATTIQLQDAKWSIEYNQPEMDKYVKEEEPIFMEIMEILRTKGLNDDERTKVIHLYVEATNAKFWEGWHSHAITEAQHAISRCEQKAIDEVKKLIAKEVSG
jgi:hypothetical protein